MPSLKAFNTFGVDVDAVEFYEINMPSDLEQFSFNNTNEYFILGGGSNLLLTQDLDIPVLKNEIKGIHVFNESEDFVELEIGGGENWHDTVLWALSQNYGGLENLSLIPGTVGASPIQNIGAYGTEVKDVILKVFAFDMITKSYIEFDNNECQFSYRDSFFKKPENKGRYFITKVILKLHKDLRNVNFSYGPISKILKSKNIDAPTIHDISDVVINLRRSKLPDPKEIGNSGSFFKNPIVSKSILKKITTLFDDVPFYPVSEELVKIPAGWLIEKCGWKGKRIGNTGNYKNQALIIINYGNATGMEIYNHAENVRDSVMGKFGISLDFEVNIL